MLTNRWEVILHSFLPLLVASKSLGTALSASKGIGLSEEQVIESITTRSQIRSICSPEIIVFKFGGQNNNGHEHG